MPSDQTPPQNPSEEKITGESEKRESGGDKPNGPSADFSALIDAIKNEGIAYRNEEQREDSAKKFREWITIGLLVCTVIAIGWQVYEMIHVYGPIRDQADAEGRAAYAEKIAAAAASQQSIAATKQSENSDKALVESQRAWAGPNGAKIDGPVGVNTALRIETAIQNTGREPALNFTYYITPLFASEEEDRNGVLSGKIANFVQACLATPPKFSAQVLYPAAGFGGGFNFTTTVDKNLVTKEVIGGSKILVVPGCLIYDTFNKTRHSTFCFFFKGGSTKPDNLNLCVNGSTAD